jgi:hypothetical protein
MFPHDIFDLVRREKLYAHAARRPSTVPKDILLSLKKKKADNLCIERQHAAFVLYWGPRAKAVFGETVGVHAGTRLRVICVCCRCCAVLLCVTTVNPSLLVCICWSSGSSEKLCGKIHAKKGFNLHTSAHTPHIAGLEVGKNSSLGSI